MSLIDSHFHIFSANTPFATERWGHRQWPAPLSDIMAQFEQFDVSHGVITTSSEYGLYHEEFAAALAAHDNLRATVNVPLNATRPQLMALKDQGFVGTRFHWRFLDETPDPTDAEHQRLLRLCADIGWHVHLTERADRIERTLCAFETAGLRVVVDHMGFLDTAKGVDDPGFQAILAAMGRGQTWVTLSGGFRFKQCNPDDLARALIAEGGSERLMWASDWPFVGYHGKVKYGEAIAALPHHIRDADMRGKVGFATAKRFYFDR